MEKLEWCGYPMVEKFRRYVYSFWHDPRTWQTHTHTHRYRVITALVHSIMRQKLSSLELWTLLTTVRMSYIAYSKNPFLELWDDLEWWFYSHQCTDGSGGLSYRLVTVILLFILTFPLEGLLSEAEHDLLATAKFLVLVLYVIVLVCGMQSCILTTE